MSTPRRTRAALALLAAALGGAACADLQSPPKGAARRTAADSADQVVFGSRTLITDRGLLRAEVFSDTAYFFQDNTQVDMRIVRGVFFNSQGAKDAVMTGRRAVYSTRTLSLEATGDVVIISVDGRTLKTPQLRFDQATNQISSDSAFTLTEPDRELQGIGFSADPDLNNIRVLKRARGKAGTVTLPGGS